MKQKSLTAIVLLVSLLFIGSADTALAEDDVGTVVAIRGKAFIERDDKSFEAEVRDNLFMNDTVSTKEASRAKMLFIDDSVLTIGENSQVVIKEVIYSKHKMGRSVFSLVEGKMRSIVGKTQFEVHTPTAVAAARGTVILTETGVTEDGRRYTIIIVLEGEAVITSTEPGVAGSETLTEGMMIMIFEGEPILPTPTVAPIEEIERLQNATDSDREISIPGPVKVSVGPEGLLVEPAGMLPPQSPPIVDQQPPTPATTPVEIDVIFPN
jgi:hypothetical protein